MVNALRRLRAKNADDAPETQAQTLTQNQNQVQTQTLNQLQTQTLIRTWRRAVPALLLSSGLVLSACSAGVDNDDGSEAASEPGTEPATEPAIDTYVALGDSYAAMASRAGADDSGDLAADFCRRSPDNYPAVLGDLLAANTVIDRSCQGAIIDNLTATRDAGGVAVPAQLHALSETDEGAIDRTVDLVTLTIGGNDIGFGEMVWCAQHALETAEPSNCGAYMDRKVDTKPVWWKTDYTKFLLRSVPGHPKRRLSPRVIFPCLVHSTTALKLPPFPGLTAPGYKLSSSSSTRLSHRRRRPTTCSSCYPPRPTSILFVPNQSSVGSIFRARRRDRFRIIRQLPGKLPWRRKSINGSREIDGIIPLVSLP